MSSSVALHLTFRARPLPETRPYQLTRRCSVTSKGSAYLHIGTRVSYPAFYVGARHLNSGSHAYFVFRILFSGWFPCLCGKRFTD